ncbi:MAG: hypothetical protein K9K86_12125 [Pseudomonadales bacterium]|nr:hypothetical protein [Pseudomonadales bacterium]
MEYFIGQTGQDSSAQKEALSHAKRLEMDNQDDLLFADGKGIGRFSDEHVEVIVRGEPRFHPLGDVAVAQNLNAQLISDEYKKYGFDMFERIKGHFVFVIRDKINDRMIIALDKLGTYPVYYAKTVEAGYIFSDNLTQLVQHSSVNVSLSNQAIFNYTYFHMIPSPGTIYEGVFRVDAACYLLWEQGDVKTVKYWVPRFREDNLKSGSEIASGLYRKLKNTIASYRFQGDAGCFLSGGLDSSSVAGFMAKSKDTSVSAFSIGFPIEEYNELPYARIAADEYQLAHFEKILTPGDVLNVLPQIIQHMEQPFGNSSVIPVFCCADFAKQNGVNTLFAGDGGDELFAGNTRYQKQLIFELYHLLPSGVRSFLHESAKDGLIGRAQLTRKLSSYIKQAEIGLPQRLEQYNFLNKIDVSEVFTPSFMQSVDTNYPEELCQTVFQTPEKATAVSKMLYLDWKHTLTDNDLLKVRSMCDLAGVDVKFPMLDDDLIEYSCDIPSHYKVNLTKLRRIYKNAVKGFLPNKIIHKKKHGFGLPFGLWIQEDAELRTYAYNALDKLKSFNIYPESFIEFAKKQHQENHASYYGELIWILMVLGEWLTKHELGQQRKQ